MMQKNQAYQAFLSKTIIPVFLIRAQWTRCHKNDLTSAELGQASIEAICSAVEHCKRCLFGPFAVGGYVEIEHSQCKQRKRNDGGNEIGLFSSGHAILPFGNIIPVLGII